MYKNGRSFACPVCHYLSCDGCGRAHPRYNSMNDAPMESQIARVKGELSDATFNLIVGSNNGRFVNGRFIPNK